MTPFPTRTLRSRTAGATVLAVVLSVLLAPGSQARPGQNDLADARAKLATLNDRLSALVEEYNAAKLEADRTALRLEDLRTEAARAERVAATAQERLGERAAFAYEQGVASRLDLLLSSASFGDFSARLEFLNRLSGNDSDLAIEAGVARERAAQTTDRLTRVLSEQRAVLSQLSSRRSEIEGGVREARSLVDRIQAALRRPVVVDPPAAAASQEPLDQIVPNASAGAQAALEAAYSQIGTPYRYAGADPSTGFDCSGFTMWSWAHAGVSLPHSSAAQYASLPHVSKEDLQPGDLVFFYNPIHHVGMYVGNGQMIDAPHTGSYVGVRDIWWDVYTGAARPGV